MKKKWRFDIWALNSLSFLVTFLPTSCFVFGRRRQGSTLSMVSETLIIIVVVAAVAVFALLLVSYMFWSKSKRNAIPLPPVQPLAHDRERGLQALAAEKEREKSLYLQLVAPSWPDIKSAGSSESGSTANTYPPVPPGISPVKRYPHSVASSARSNLSSGIPHAPNSTVQIVLPAPLSLASNFVQDTSRYSVADEWASQAIYNGKFNLI